ISMVDNFAEAMRNVPKQELMAEIIHRLFLIAFTTNSKIYLGCSTKSCSSKAPFCHNNLCRKNEDYVCKAKLYCPGYRYCGPEGYCKTCPLQDGCLPNNDPLVL
ncbi:8885_t:CDS:2, partial [Racocetra persica]